MKLKTFLRKYLCKNDIRVAQGIVANELKRIHGHTVAYGIFKGMKLSDKAWWGDDLPTKILGEYERHVQEKLKELSRSSKILIDIGAADGFFAIGCLVSNLYEKVVCFEISDEGRELLVANAKANQVDERIVVKGEAAKESLRNIVANLESAVILCDIEGAEFDLFSEELLKILNKCYIVIELHESAMIKGQEMVAQLGNSASKYFDVDFIYPLDININKYKELNSFHDNYRLLAFSEGRGVSMRWMVLSPKT